MLAIGQRAGRTRLVDMRCRVPFHVGRVLHPQPDWPELAHLLVTMPTGGFVQGDVADMAVVAEAGALAHLTSQSATRAYRCESDPIHQRIRLEARGDSLLEWWPDPLIPYAGTRLRQDVSIVAHEQATVLLADCWLAGRIARGEIHQYDRLALTTTAERPDGRLLFRDSLRIEPSVQPPLTLDLLGHAHAIGSYYLIGPGLAARLESSLGELLARLLPGRAACSRLPHEAGLVARVLAPTADDLRTVQREILRLARERLFGRGVGHVYKP